MFGAFVVAAARRNLARVLGLNIARFVPILETWRKEDLSLPNTVYTGYAQGRVYSVVRIGTYVHTRKSEHLAVLTATGSSTSSSPKNPGQSRPGLVAD